MSARPWQLRLGFLLVLMTASAPRLVGQDDILFGPMREDRGTEARAFNLHKTWLSMRLDEQAKTFDGSVTHQLSLLGDAVDEIWFDAKDLMVTGVLVDEELVSYRLEDDRLSVSLPLPQGRGGECFVTIEYSGQDPERGLYFIAPDDDEPDLAREIWSQGQAEDNRYWIPTWDYPTDRAQYEAWFTVRDGLTAVSNGKLLEVAPEEDGWTTWHYRLDFPFPAYLISICVGRYEKYEDEWRGIPVEYYVQEGVGEAKARRSFGETPAILEHFSALTGVTYPYPKYSQVAVQRFVVGGMENISATTQSDRTLHSEREALDRSSRGLVAHEAAHQWFGDYVTCRTWRHLWLNEGFATYFEALYEREAQGEDEFQLNLRNDQRGTVRRDRQSARPLVESFFNRAPEGGGNNNVYARGSSVLAMIHQQLGARGFRAAIQHYLSSHAAELVDSHDFEVAIEEATGQNLHWLFEQFVYLPGHPEFEVSQRYDAAQKGVVLSVKQAQDTSGTVPIYRLPVPFEVTCAERVHRQTVWIDQVEQEIRLPASSEPLMVRFDKGSRLLKELRFDKSDREWAYQAQYDSDAVGRIDAVEALAGAADKVLSRQVLEAVLLSGDHARIRAAAAASLAKLGGEAAVGALLAGLRDRESRVRRACASGLADLAEEQPDLGDAAVSTLAASLRDDLSYGVQAAAASALGKWGGDQALAALQEASWFDSPEHRVAAAAQKARIKLADESCRGEVLELLETSDPAARRLGLGLAGSLADDLLGDQRPQVVEILLAAAENGAPGSQSAAIRSLGELKVVEARPLLKQLAEESSNRRVRFRARNVLSAWAKELPEDEPDEAKVLRSTVKELQDEVQQLRQRLEELEKNVTSPLR